jgi:hypothetical protein
MNFVDILSAYLTPIIGLTTISILVLQYLLQRYKIRHDLYEPRIKIYRAVYAFLIHAAQNGDVKNEALADLIQNTAEARFLFRGKIKKHIDLMYNKGLQMQLINQRLRDNRVPKGEERNKLADTLSEHAQWFSKQFDKTNKLFSKYLTLDE